MADIKIKLSNGKEKNYPKGTKVEEILKDTGMDDKAIAAKVNGKVIDLYRPLETDAEVEPVEIGTADGLDVLRHSTAHVMAQAVARIFGDVEFAIGPNIEDGFYYDFDLDHRFTDDDLEKIETEMQKIKEEDLPIRRIEMSKADSLKKLEAERALFKSELLREVDEEIVSFYNQGEFTDWCRGPHLTNTGMLGSFKLMSIAGAYWRGSETREMLQRIYGTAWFTQEELADYLNRLEEAKKRDHKKLGRELDLFSFQKEGPGFPFWHPKGTILFNKVVNYLRSKLEKAGYVEVITPMILHEDLWHQSGHWDHYKENMYFTDIDDSTYAVKPMNCPGSTLIYRNTLCSYRDLPIRMAEFGVDHRHEKSGVLNGLFRVRAFTMDDAHIFCTPDQVEAEVLGMIDLVIEVYSDFGFKDYRIELSTRPLKSIGSDGMWQNAEKALENALRIKGIEFDLSPGEGAFYGPKIDFHVKDSLKRSWQCGTIQIDFSMPERFNMSYIAADGQKHRPVMIHRALLGSMERFIGIMIEHYGGAFPSWLAPEQVRVIPVSSEKFGDYANKVNQFFVDANIRSSVDGRSESLNYRIRDAQVKKVPYMLVVGAREEQNSTVSVRRRDEVDLGPMDTKLFLEKLTKEIETKAIDLTIGKD